MTPIASVVVGVVREALRERGLAHVVLLDRPEAPVSLVRGWLDDAELPVTVLSRAPAAREALVLDPATKETLLLDGPLPGTDLLPLGDVWGSRARSGKWAGTLERTERALEAVFDRGLGLDALVEHLDAREAAEVRRRLLRTAPLLRPPVVPKLTGWTAGIDPGP